MCQELRNLERELVELEMALLTSAADETSLLLERCDAVTKRIEQLQHRLAIAA